MGVRHADTTNSPVRWWLRGLGIVWLALFVWWFYSFPLPNGQLADGTKLSRTDVWLMLPEVLWENVAPTPNPNAPSSGWRYLPQRLDLIAVAVSILAGAWGLGQLMLRLLGVRDRFDHLTGTVFAFALGLSGLSLLTLGCGLMGFLHRGLLGGILLALVVLECMIRIRSCLAVPRAPKSSEDANSQKGDHSDSREKAGGQKRPWSQRRWDMLPAVCLLVITPFLLAMLLGAMLPSIDFDVKAYHFQGPKEFFLRGQVTFLSHNVYTSFPFLTEMLSLLAMVLRDDWYRGALAGKVVLMSMAPLTALGLFAAGRRWFGSTVGWLCVLLYLTTPWIYRISIIAYAEGGLTFYLFVTLLAVMWMTTRKAAPSTNSSIPSTRSSEPLAASGGHVLLCGLLAGSAVACKYPGALSVAIPLGGAALIAAWRQSKQAVRDTDAIDQERTVVDRFRQVGVVAGLLTLGTLLTFGPWMAKNSIETGNPVYPLLYPVFGGQDWDAADHDKWQNGHPPMILRLKEHPEELPANIAERLIDVAAKSDWQSPLLFGCAPLALLWAGRRRLVLSLWAYVGWLFLTWWALTHQIDRFWIPMLPVATLLAGVGLGWLFGEATGEAGPAEAGFVWGRQVSLLLAIPVSLLIAAAMLFNLGFVTTSLCGYNAYLMDLETARRSAPPTERSIALLNRLLPEDAQVLFVGGAAVFDAEFDTVYNTVFDKCLFEQWTSAAQPGLTPSEQPLRPAAEIRRELHEQRITHVFVDWNEILRHRVPGGYGYTDFVAPQRFRDLVKAQVLRPVALDPRQVLARWEDVDPNTQAVVEEWGPSLYREVERIPALMQYELFEVR